MQRCWHYFGLKGRKFTAMRLKKILIGVGAATVVGLGILYVVRRLQSRHMRTRISDEGFETARDVLYPSKRRRFGKHRLGPILPE